MDKTYREFPKGRVMLRSVFLAICLPPVLVFSTCGAAGGAEVELELVTQQGFPLTGSRQWIEAFKGLDVRLRIRSATPGDRVEVVERGTPNSPVFHGTGLLTRQNTLLVPGGRFSPRDRAAISAWVSIIS